MATQTEAVLPVKRPRLGDEEAKGAALVDIPDPEVWFSDRNVIVAAVDEAKKEKHLFKCHRDMLAQRLPALGDMFEAGKMASSVSASEHIDSLPIVHLYNPPEYVRALLQVLFNSWSVVSFLH